MSGMASQLPATQDTTADQAGPSTAPGPSTIQLPPIPEGSDSDDSDYGEDNDDGSGSEQSGEEMVYDGEVEAEGDDVAQSY